MYTKARQWPLQMTAGLQPVQLVHNYQLGHLILMFSLKKALLEGLIEPLMSPAVWKSSMGEIKQVALNKHVWPISGLVSVQIKYDEKKQEIQVVVTFRADVAQIGEANRALAEVFGEDLPNEGEVIKSPQLKYTFNEDEAGSRSFSKTKGG